MALAKGQVAPPSSFVTKEGDARSLDEILAAGPAVIAFYKVTCPVCQLTMPYLERLRGGSLQVVSVSQDDAEAAAEFDFEFGARTDLLDSEDAGYPASNAFRITNVPSLFLVEPGRKITWQSVGFYKKDLESLAERAGRPIFQPGERVPEAKAG
jgi:peroxiredoxin